MKSEHYNGEAFGKYTLSATWQCDPREVESRRKVEGDHNCEVGRLSEVVLLRFKYQKVLKN